ncbi:MAG: hypothetical protein JSR09_11120 [Bacteroidetes bacterium]|nr:hypothetical protein [Bacteroidota bacterium]MBS1650242.1 hypothetical protein [Bacteroidota bacterium]
MKTKINWKKFIISSIVIFVVFVFIADVIIDFKNLDWSKIFGFENLFWKILAALVGAFFYSSYKIEKKD